jgi:hypothetical protein
LFIIGIGKFSKFKSSLARFTGYEEETKSRFGDLCQVEIVDGPERGKTIFINPNDKKNIKFFPRPDKNLTNKQKLNFYRDEYEKYKILYK